MSSNKLEVESWLHWRETGLSPRLGTCDRLHKRLYSSVECVATWNPAHTLCHNNHGAIFNFDFSPDGSLLVAACERKSVLVFDPLAGKLIHAVEQAHSDCVNCVRFLDSRMFVTCSDDTTVCLWDARYLKQKIRTLRGHSNWVKNIEYASNSGLLVTSGFDGSIYAWHINSYSERDAGYTRIFHTNGLMRSKLTPDGTKLIIATAGGYLMVVHNLDLMSLANDLHGFKPNMYRLMQMSQSPIRYGYTYNHVFCRKRNRVELISDFPPHNEAEMIASLEVHPQGWCVVSRNTSSDESSEWTCVHDIQTNQRENGDEDLPKYLKDSWPPLNAPIGPDSPHRVIQTSLHRNESNDAMPGSTSPGHSQPTLPGSEPGSSEPSRSSSPAFVLSISMNDSTTSSPALSPTSNPRSAGSEEQTVRTPSHSTPEWTEGDEITQSNDSRVSGSQSSESEANESQTVSSPSSVQLPSSATDSQDNDRTRESVTFVIRSGSQVAERTLLLLGGHNRTPCTGNQPKIYENQARLTHYIEEPNIGRGFIKEVCFSNDGRLICSPFGFGVRLLAFNPDCSEICDCITNSPVKLYEVTTNMSHTSAVLTTKFSPTHSLLVTGCLNGKVDFHQPVP